MNGRPYDPLLGRFISADILVDGMDDLQGYNRYSYVKNRPLSMTDPTGYFGMGMSITKAGQVTTLDLKQIAEHPLGRIAGGSLETAAGFVPGLGDAMDIKDAVSPNSTSMERGIAAGSLTLNALTGGLAPNAAPIMKGVAKMGDGFSALLRGPADAAAHVATKSADEVGGTAAHAVDVKVAAPAMPNPVETGSLKTLQAPQAAEKSQGPVIIGETMARVEQAATKMPGSKILNDMPDFKAMGMAPHEVTNAMMAHNRKWILEQIRSGRPIFDIGRDTNRARPSIFYDMEQNMLKNYRRLHPEFNGAIPTNL